MPADNVSAGPDATKPPAGGPDTKKPPVGGPDTEKPPVGGFVHNAGGPLRQRASVTPSVIIRSMVAAS